ncbi:MAG: SGNH/GDSL hydrolase family protein [Chthonomonadales bacterium]
MRIHRIFSLILLSLIACTLRASSSTLPELAQLKGVKRILVLGDSITYGGGYVDVLDEFLARHYPEKRYEVINLGLPSETVSGLSEAGHAGGAFPRPCLAERLDRALKMIKPDLVIACYGMNDGIYYPFAEDRFKAYQKGMTDLRTKVIAAHAKFWVMTPPPFDPKPIMAQTSPAGIADYPSGKPFVGYDGVLGKYSDWLISERAHGWNVIDLHGPLNAYVAEMRGKSADFTLSPDGVHQNETGHRLMAKELLNAWGAEKLALPQPVPLDTESTRSARAFSKFVHERQQIMKDAWLTKVGHKRPGMAKGLPIAEAISKAADLSKEIYALAPGLPPLFPGKRSDYHGFDRFDSELDGCKTIVVVPQQTAPTRPWIWRAEFFDHRPELDLDLLKRGFHLVYIEVGNTFGAPSAMKHWDAFYTYLTKMGLSPKLTLEGLSRGGLYIYNWAAANPTKVSVIYGDNPVLDFKSWPGGKGVGPGSPSDWKKLQDDYGFKSEGEALAYTKNPIDNLKALAKARVPIIHLCGDADEVVPYSENTVILQKRYQRMGGEIKVIVKPGFKHHPHGLDDPTPIVEFILRHTVGVGG